MFFKKKSIYFKEERWCLGTQIEQSGNILIPVFKINFDALSNDPFLCQGKSIFQGVIHITDSDSRWLTVENIKLEELTKYLPEVKVYMNKEATHGN